MNKLTVIYYHEVVEEGEGFSYQKIEKSKFEEQMWFLKEKGYQTIGFDDLAEPLPEKAVLVSFDDGFRTVYENAAPIMNKYGIKGNVYLPTAFIGTDEHFMTWNMVRRLRVDYKFCFAAHTHNHVDIRVLDTEDMNKEIFESGKKYEEELGYQPAAFCMPFGTYDRKSIHMLRKTQKYKYLFASFYGASDGRKLENKVIPRIGISNDDSIEIFEKKLKGGLNWKGPLQRLRLFIGTIKGQRIRKYEY